MKIDLALNNLQGLMCHKIRTTNQPTFYDISAAEFGFEKFFRSFKVFFLIFSFVSTCLIVATSNTSKYL